MPPKTLTSSQSDGVWQDETYDVNMAQICATVRARSATSQELTKNYNWFADAVAPDALLPPGVPLSLGEICVYYPHHVRWQDVMFRLVQNDYHRQDILGIQVAFRGPHQDHMSPSIFNQIQRDAMKRRLPEYKTVGYKGKGDPDMRTGELKPGLYLDDRLQGFFVPSFDDLLRGLNYIPSEPDARALTQCLTWYLQTRDSFSPRLELNVMHTQALIRALRQPLSPVTSQNLNRCPLELWQKNKTPNKIEVTDLEAGANKGRCDQSHIARSAGERAVINTQKNTVQAEVRIPLRNILTFPFLALHGIVSKAFEMGIDRAERKLAVRTTPTKQPTPAESATAPTTNVPSSSPSPLKRGYATAESGDLLMPPQTPKRQRKFDGVSGKLGVRTPKQPTVSPITPRVAPPQPSYTIPRDTLVNLEFGLRKRGPARKEP